MQPKKDNVSVLIPFFDDDQDEENTPSTPEININKDIPKQEKIIEDGDELESDEENDAQDFQNPVPLSKVENYSLQNIIVPKYSSDDLTQPELKKIYELKVYTEEAIAKTVKNKNSSNIVKSLVSKKKNRFCYDGFDLDLTYITTRIIAMGMPSSNLEGLYRNPMEEVQKFLNTRHNEHHKVYNLCEERGYPKNSFYKQEVYPFKDHEAPPLNLMKSFCEDAKSFLDEDEKNIVAIHCKAGKGRTGTMICCLLLYMKIFETANECLQYYGMMRAENGKGVTIPSQIRYVNYFEKILKSNMQHPIIFIKKCIKKIRMFTLPKFHGNYTPFFKIENNDNIYNSEKKKTEFKKEDLNAVVDFDIEKGFIVSGDVRVIFYRNKLITKQKENIFKFWFNTNFIPNDSNIYQFKKNEIDKACKDEECKYYSKAFLIEIHFIDV
jgi:phosphatidylinositol-3,4,5-trisphosphate 3-phosphatase/dual-specificity protein phosphatase PTEN